MKTRATQEVFDGLVDRAHRQSEAILKIRALVDKFDQGFWDALVERLEARIKARQENRDNTFMAMSDVELKADIAAEVALKGVIAMPDEYRKTLEKMEVEHRELTKRVREYRDRIKA